jgi:acyl-coenzyme A thioesterase PaaI-like protein
MSSHNDAPGARLLRSWNRLSRLPFGRWIFNRMLGRMVPYTGALGARVEVLEPGRSVVTLADRRAVRNHLESIHAVALANLAELTSGTAMLTALPAGTRGIVTRMEIDFLKKARGPVTGRSTVKVPSITAPTVLHPEAELTDSASDVVARARVTWHVSPIDDGRRR